MNIDQLLRPIKNEKLSPVNGHLSDSSNSEISQNRLTSSYDKKGDVRFFNQSPFDFLNGSNSDHTTNLLKTVNQLGLNSNLIENFLLKNASSNASSFFISDQIHQPTSSLFEYTNGQTRKTNKKVEENSCKTYFNKLLNENKLTDSQGDPSNNKISQEVNVNDQQKIAAAFAVCYSATTGNSNNNKFADAMIDWTKHNSSNDYTNEWNHDSSQKLSNLYRHQKDQSENRPVSRNSVNCSISSTDTDCDESINKRPIDFNDKSMLSRTYSDFLSAKEFNTIKPDSDEEIGIDRLPLYASMGLFGLDGLNESVFVEYQSWAQSTYGDSAKTKTVTKKKYERIVKILNGQEPNNVENSKFRFWVKSKGFRLGRFDNDRLLLHTPTDASQDILYVPCIKSSASNSSSTSHQSANHLRNKNHSFLYKRVAVVENFFQIIYSVHVEMEGKAGKHAGQKRTYRAVAQRFAFLPREAVTRFLMSCKDCQKRMHLHINSFSKPKIQSRQPVLSPMNNNKTELKQLLKASLNPTALSNLNSIIVNSTIGEEDNGDDCLNVDHQSSDVQSTSSTSMNVKKELDFIPSAYLKQMNRLPKTQQTMLANQNLDNLMCNNLDCNSNQRFSKAVNKDLSINDHESDSMSSLDEHDCLAENLEDAELLNRNFDQNLDRNTDENIKDQLANDSIFLDREILKKKIEEDESFSQTRGSKRFKTEHLSDEDEMIDELVEENLECKDEENNQLNKEDVFEFKEVKESCGLQEDDEEDEEDDCKSDGSLDPDRIKAFNMFVRLFVDENLNRGIPISRQPKEKIHAILDSCKRQFPEFQSRARKRIRTYLKSCRRTKKIQNLRKIGQGTNSEMKNLDEDIHSFSNGFHLTISKESLNQPVYHLNSANAERILSEAFENEIMNARRIRHGLSPLKMEANDTQDNQIRSSTIEFKRTSYQTFDSNLLGRLIGQKDSQQAIGKIDKTINRLNRMTNNSLENLKIASNKDRNLIGLLNGRKSDESNSTNYLISNNNQIRELFSIEQLISNEQLLSNQPVIDKASERELIARLKSNKKRFLTNLYNLSGSELVAIKQLITGYRESASNLLRSAQELEFLLFQQQN